MTNQVSEVLAAMMGDAEAKQRYLNAGDFKRAEECEASFQRHLELLSKI